MTDRNDPAETRQGPRDSQQLEELVEAIDARPCREPGTVLSSPDDSYTISALLRDGAAIRLYECADTTGRVLWLKEATGDAASVLRREAELLAGIDIPMIPRIHSRFSAEGCECAVTEPCDGDTLESLLRSGEAIDAGRIVSILCQVAAAVKRLHSDGLVHLGLRPSVIVPGRPTKIVDFSHITRSGEIPPRKFYHAGYSAPELLTDTPVDGRADIYSIGAILFHAVSGAQIPETGAELLAWEPDNAIGGIPQILHRCLCRSEHRYGSMAALHGDLIRLAKRLQPAVSYSINAATSIGLEPTRTTNQDAYAFATGAMEGEEDSQTWAFACVADGMGGMEGGETASRSLARSVESQALAAVSSGFLASAEAQAQEVRRWLLRGNESACSALERIKAKGGATAIAVCLVGRRLALAHVGDCRAYLVRDATVSQLTNDHSLAMALVHQGELRIDELRAHPDRSKVTRSLGERHPIPDYFIDTLEQATGNATTELVRGDVLALCSDGVWEPLLESRLLDILAECDDDLALAARRIVEATLQEGGPDNATIVLVRCNS